MKGHVKFFIASLIIFAASIGFFAGSFCNKPCLRADKVTEHSMMPPKFEERGHHGDFKPGKFGKGPGHKGPSPEVMDSLLQITPEQKIALEKNRAEVDSTNKILRSQKFEAEKELGQALDSENAEAIEAAKSKVIEAQKALLDHRINSMAALNKILTKEQREKFRAFHKENMKKFKKHMGPKHEDPKN